MARYDGSPDAFPGVRDGHRDLNLDRWPDPPAGDEEPARRSEPDRVALDPPSDAEDTLVGVVDLRSPGNPADWATSYESGVYTSSFTFDAPLPPLPADPAAPGGPDDDREPAAEQSAADAPYEGRRRHGAVIEPEQEPPASTGPVTSIAPPPAAAPEPTTVLEPGLPATAYEPPPASYEPPPASYEPPPSFAPPPSYEPSARHDDPGSATTRTDWNIPPAPMGPSLSGAESLTADSVLRYRRQRPQSGWRRSVYEASRGKVNLGPSRAERRRAEMVAAARTPIAGCHRLAVISLKGGVGKTTTTAALGAMFATLRGDRVIAVDANPDRGTLGERVPRESGATVRHLLEARDRLTRYADVRHFTSQSPTRLEVLASDADPSASLAYSEKDYRDTVATLERFYNLILTDCGTGLLHSAMAGILGLANSLVVVSSASLDGARSASATLDWLEAHGRDDLARNAVVVISSVRPGGGIVDVLQLEDHFAARCRAVVTIPYDPHLEAGGVLDLEELAPDTSEAYYELAAEVAQGFGPAR